MIARFTDEERAELSAAIETQLHAIDGWDESEDEKARARRVLFEAERKIQALTGEAPAAATQQDDAEPPPESNPAWLDQSDPFGSFARNVDVIVEATDEASASARRVRGQS